MFKKKDKIIFLLLNIFLFVSCNVMAGREDAESKYEDPPVTPTILLEEKIRDTEEVTQIGTGWYDARLITLGTHVYLKDEGTGIYTQYKQTSDPVVLRLYEEDPTRKSSETPSHGLLKSSTMSLGVSVDTSVLTQTERKDEKKSTYVQYDNESIKQEGKDFRVDGVLCYDGGHLVDHKFSAQGSHTDDFNYVPQHFYYNRWLKEGIVKHASGYIEIPLFTPNPPLIKVKGGGRYDAIPIGILLVPFSGRKIQNIYYFPNNQYNYRTLESNLNLKKVPGKTKKIAAVFKLKPVFCKLLWPAIIYDVRARDANLARQIDQETRGVDVIGELVDGMSILDLGEEDGEEEVMATLASGVIHQSNVKLSNVLATDKSTVEKMMDGQANPEALSQSFNVLGRFLVDYAIRNALKSEILTIYSRIMFANIITDFIECHDQVSEQAFHRIDETYKDIYEVTLEELWKRRGSMSLREIIYFANLYEKLASPFIHDAFLNDYKIVEHMLFETNVIRFIEILKELINNQLTHEVPDRSQMQNLVSLFLSAQESLSYIICNGYPPEELEDQRLFLKSAKGKVVRWGKRSASSGGSYQTSPNSETSFKKVAGLDEESIEYLGTNSSLVYPNDDSEEISASSEIEEKIEEDI